MSHLRGTGTSCTTEAAPASAGPCVNRPARLSRPGPHPCSRRRADSREPATVALVAPAVPLPQEWSVRSPRLSQFRENRGLCLPLAGCQGCPGNVGRLLHESGRRGHRIRVAHRVPFVFFGLDLNLQPYAVGVVEVEGLAPMPFDDIGNLDAVVLQ